MTALRSACNAILMAGSLILAGCQSTLVSVPHAMRCDADADLLARRCAAPRELSAGVTFAEIVDASLDDRRALSECGRSLDALREAVNRCNQAVDDFNRKIDEINAKNKNGLR